MRLADGGLAVTDEVPPDRDVVGERLAADQDGARAGGQVERQLGTPGRQVQQLVLHQRLALRGGGAGERHQTVFKRRIERQRDLRAAS